MGLGTRIFISFSVIFAVSFYYPINWVLNNLKSRYLEGVEEILVDQANILAEFVRFEIEDNQLNRQRLEHAFKKIHNRNINARIYGFLKTHVDLEIYITDSKGIVLFHSKDKEMEGKDFSRWNDVYLTLQHKYGARSTDKIPEEPDSSVLHVAAPIIVDDSLFGVLTVAKPTTNINTFLKEAKPQIIKVGLLSLFISTITSLLVSLLLTKPIKRLTVYATDVGKGRKTRLPQLPNNEIGQMGLAIEEMKIRLDGKKYIEQYVQNLTHEIKSPLSGIRAAAELIDENMPRDRQKHFLENILTETNRIQQIIDRMLELSLLETKNKLHKIEVLSPCLLVQDVLMEKKNLISQKNINIQVSDDAFIRIKGDAFLLKQAFGNLIQNAIEFCPLEGQIQISCYTREGNVMIQFKDNGPGIPEYALSKIFNKFFSLERPMTGKKSTGLGLNLVNEVLKLHNGNISIHNRIEAGVKVEIQIPLQIKKTDALKLKIQG